jgi:signal transduction histidine kinase
MDEMLKRTLGPNISIETDIHNHGAAAVSERTQLELAILNLALNARDAMPQGGILRISSAAVRMTDDAELAPATTFVFL